MAKSLKSFKTESSVRKEIDSWNESECEDYMAKHQSDKSQSSLLKKKLKIVQEILNIKKAQKAKGKKREALLSGMKIEKLIKYAPTEARDPKPNSLRNYQKNTGIYLWKKGYNPKRFLGAGANGVVWECDGKAVKVTCDRTYGPLHLKAAAAEVKDLQKLKKILEELQSGKSGKVKGMGNLSDINYVGREKVGKRAVFVSDLAGHGTLGAYAKKKGNQEIKDIIRLIKQALKGLNIIHEAGYSHNDIKPDNLLVIEKIKEDAVKKDVLKISDFGAMTKIDATYNVFGNMRFRAPDANNLKSDAVAKRDSYSTGAVALFILIKGKNRKDIEKELISKDSEWVYYRYGLDEIYGEENKDKVVKFLDLISKMVQPSYQKRISIEDALEEIRKID